MRVNQVKLLLENIAADSKVRLIGITPAFEYENGAKTDKQLGFTYECLAEQNGFEKFTVRVADSTPVLTVEQLADAKEPVYIAFSEFIGKFYFSERTKTWELSCKSSKAIIVKQAPKA